jgi:hypothetical protein
MMRSGVAPGSPTVRGVPCLPRTQARQARCSGVRTLLSLLILLLLLAAQHVRQLVFTHKLGQRQASVVLAARVVEVIIINDIINCMDDNAPVFVKIGIIIIIIINNNNDDTGSSRATRRCRR